MQKIKSIQRSALKSKQDNEGVRVVKKGKGKPASKLPTEREKKSSVFEQVKSIAINLSVKWVVDNWSLIHDKASACIDVLMEVLK